MTRPAVDVVIPFAGSQTAFEELLERLGQLELTEDDSLTVVDNRADATPASQPDAGSVTVVAAPERRSSYFARNVGVRRGRNEWIIFVDADVWPPRDLADRYFWRPPDAATAVLAGAIVDETPSTEGKPGIVPRYLHIQAQSGQRYTLGRGRFGYAQTGNSAVRRSAFEAVGGFVEDIRSGGDADLCFRLRARGWALEEREEAAAVHAARTTVRALLRQVYRHGSGAAWLNRVHPGSSPPQPVGAIAARNLRAAAGICYRLLRLQPDRALFRLVETLAYWALILGRLAPNEVSTPRRRRLARLAEPRLTSDR